jgi:hypothetical protein
MRTNPRTQPQKEGIVKRSLCMIAGALAVPVLATTVSAASPAQTTQTPAVDTAEPWVRALDQADLSDAAEWAKRAEVRERKRAARSGGLRTFGTTFTANEAAARLKRWAEQGMGGYHDQCLRLADDAYGAKGPRTSTALAQWARAREAGLGHPDSKDIPVGAQMFWRTSNSAGHIATYVGNGKVVTNMPGGAVELVDWRSLNEWGPYLGWASPYYG